MSFSFPVFQIMQDQRRPDCQNMAWDCSAKAVQYLISSQAPILVLEPILLVSGDQAKYTVESEMLVRCLGFMSIWYPICLFFNLFNVLFGKHCRTIEMSKNSSSCQNFCFSRPEAWTPLLPLLLQTRGDETWPKGLPEILTSCLKCLELISQHLIFCQITQNLFPRKRIKKKITMPSISCCLLVLLCTYLWMSSYSVERLNLKCSTLKDKTIEIKAQMKFSYVAYRMNPYWSYEVDLAWFSHRSWQNSTLLKNRLHILKNLSLDYCFWTFGWDFHSSCGKLQIHSVLWWILACGNQSHREWQLFTRQQ